MRTKSQTFSIVVLCVAALGAAVLFLYKPGDPAAAPVAPSQPIRIANIGIYSNYNILANELGFFADHGLNAEVIEHDSGATSMAALLAGEADVAVAANFVGVRNMAMNGDIRVLATLASHDVFRVVARSSAGISAPNDLAGKRIGVTRRTAGAFYLGKFLEENGMRLEDVEMVDLAPAAMLEQLTDGRLDVAILFEPNAYRFRLAHPDFVSWSAQGNRNELTTLFTTRQFIAAHPDVLERYLAALVDAARYQDANGSDAKRILAEALGYDAALMEHLWSSFAFGIRLDQELLVAMEEQARWIIGNGLVDSAGIPNYLDVIHFDALEKADPGAVTIIH